MLRDFSGSTRDRDQLGWYVPSEKSGGPARSLSSSRTIRRPQAGWSHGNGLRRYVGTASSWQSTEFDRRRSDGAVEGCGAFVRAPRVGGGGAYPSQRPRPPTRTEGRVPERQRTAGIPGRPGCCRLRWPIFSCAVFRRNGKANWARRHAALVRAETLVRSPRRSGWAAICGLGDSERAHGNSVKPNILADALEALLGCHLPRCRPAGRGSERRVSVGRAPEQSGGGPARPEDGASGMGTGPPPAIAGPIVRSTGKARRMNPYSSST